MREATTTRCVDYFHLPRPLWRKLKKVDFSHSGTKGVGYARHRSPLKVVSDAHPTHPDDTGFTPVRAIVLQARLCLAFTQPTIVVAEVRHFSS